MSMGNRWEKLMVSVRDIRLSEEEKARGRAHLHEFMTMTPIRGVESTRTKKQPFFAVLNNFFIKRKAMPIFGLILAMMLAGTGVTYAAEDAVPGDVLYPVKVHVNENIGNAFAFSEERKAKWEVRLAERRLEEAEKLAAKGEFDPEVRQRLEKRFIYHADRVHERIERLGERFGPEMKARLSSRFEASLKAHGRILSRLAETVEVTEGENETEGFAETVEGKAEEAEEARGQAENEIDTKVARPDKERAVQGRLKAAEKKIAEVTSFIDKKESDIGEDAANAAREVLVGADDLVQQALGFAEEGEYGEAFHLLQKAHRLANHAKVLTAARAKFHIGFPWDDGADDDTDDFDEGDPEDDGDEESDDETGDDEDEEDFDDDTDEASDEGDSDGEDEDNEGDDDTDEDSDEEDESSISSFFKRFRGLRGRR